MRFEVEYEPFTIEVLESGVWDLTRTSVIDSRSQASAKIGVSDIYSETVSEHSFHYILRNDTLFYRGYNVGRSVSAKVDGFVSIYSFPLLSSSTSSTYSGGGQASLTYDFDELGTIDCSISKGLFIAGVCDTISSYLVHERHRGIVLRNGNDSIPFAHEIYRWYAAGSRLPFAVQTGIDRGSTQLFFCTEQIWSDDAHHNDVDKRDAVLRDAIVTVGADAVNISLRNTTGLTIETYIVDISGNIFGYTSMAYNDDAAEIGISTIGLRQGQYMVVIGIDGTPTLTEKRIIVL